MVLSFLHQNHNVSNQTLWCLAFMSFELAGKMRVNIENKLTGCFLLSLQKNIIMTDISLKYSLLSNSARQEVNDFMDFLLNKQKEKKSISLSGYKKKILSVSTWTDSDIQVFKENQKLFNSWKIDKW